MATPIAHAAAGIITWSLALAIRPEPELSDNKKLLLAFAALGMLPDLDLLLGYVLTGDIRTYHAGITHTFIFAACTGTVIGILLQHYSFHWFVGIASFFAVSSHILIDWITGPEVGMLSSYGLSPYWPFQNQEYAMPVTLFKGIGHGEGIQGWFSIENLETALKEIIIFTPLAVVFWWVQRWRTRKATLAK